MNEIVFLNDKLEFFKLCFKNKNKLGGKLFGLQWQTRDNTAQLDDMYIKPYNWKNRDDMKLYFCIYINFEHKTFQLKTKPTSYNYHPISEMHEIIKYNDVDDLFKNILKTNEMLEKKYNGKLEKGLKGNWNECSKLYSISFN